MIKLFGFGPAFKLPDPSPFVTKINLYMKACDLEFESVASVKNLRKAPKEKLPFIDDDGIIVADSVFIIDHLKANHNADLDTWLTPEETATAQLISKSLDENFYWSIVYARWIKDDVWPIVRAQFFDPLPFPANKLVATLARNATRKQIIGHGMGKHSDTEITKIALKTMESISTLLGGKDYFFGDRISTLDVTAYAMIGSFTMTDLDTELGRKIKEYENINSFTQRIGKIYYPELYS